MKATRDGHRDTVQPAVPIGSSRTTAGVAAASNLALPVRALGHIRTRVGRASKFAAVGVLGALLKLALMFALTDLAGLHYMVSFGLSFAVVVVHNYLLNSRLTFHHSCEPMALGKYALVSVASAVVKAALVFLLTDVAGMWYLLSTAIAIAAGFVLNYVMSLRWVWLRRAGQS